MLEVLAPGLLTTIQDRGRPDAAHLGVPVGGACDPWSLAAVNALLGNDPGAAAVEMTLAGPSFAVLRDCVVGIAGADLGARLDDRPLSPGTTVSLRAGQTLAFDAAVDGSGIRAYVALAGGVDVPVVLGSRSTCLVGSFGGLDGRPLAVGDRISSVGVSAGATSQPAAPAELGRARDRLRVIRGPHAGILGEEVLDGLLASQYTVSARSDRQGIRLEGPALAVPAHSASMLSQGVTWGAIQVPFNGQPICLLADHQTVGGYPVVAVVATVDRPALGQLGPGDAVSFELVSLEEAQMLARLQASEWAEALGRLTPT